MAPGISTLGPLHGQVGLCLQTIGSLQTVFQVYSHWAWENDLQGWVGLFGGLYFLYFRAGGFVSSLIMYS